MQVFGRTSLSEFLGDRVVFRNLVPLDDQISSLNEIRAKVGLPEGRIPRKSETDYARVIVEMLGQARAVDAPGAEIVRLIFFGDTRLNDGTAFANLCQVGQWPGLAFIGSETRETVEVEIVQNTNNQSLFLANRWSALSDFELFCQTEGFLIDEQTAVIVDIDKTALGARGRNAQVIDQARVQAVKDTVSNLMGDDFDSSGFQNNYDLLNQVEYHQFTTDNQDYLAYICLILGSGNYDLNEIVGDIKSGSLKSFEQFILQVEDQSDQLQPELAAIHEEIFAYVQAGDPTPFKAFRRNEYLCTVGVMGQLDDSMPVDSYLESEIVITQEVRSLAMSWLEKGALFFALSDKPDEASIPTEELVGKGYLPIHRTITHAVGMRQKFIDTRFAVAI